MADELKRSQLARIVVPAITDVEYSKGLADAFDKINDNFKKIASLPFLQGVQGDSYQLEEYPIWEKDTTENWILTEDGKILLDSIFGIDTTRDGNSFSDIRECIGQLMPEENGVSPIDFFKSGNDIINNSLYFYIIKDDTGNIIEKQLGQYYYFVDGRLKEVGNIYNSENAGGVLSVFNDYTGFYQYKYDAENSIDKYIKIEILPTIYYDQNKNDICWKFNGNETGISAIGVKGADGKDADLSIVKVDLNNESRVYSSSPTSGKVIGILNTSANNGETAQWITDVKYFKTGKALIYMSGNIPIENPEENTINPLSEETETTETTINDFTYGEIVKQDDEYIAYWEPNCVFSKMLINNAFAKYFYNMGSVSYTNNAPYFLAIPSIQNRDSSTEEAKQHAHVIKGYAGNKDKNIESLNIFHSDNAFDEVGNQQINATLSNSDKALNIKNYNVNISKTLTTKGKITGESGLEVVGAADIGGSLTVNGALEVTEASEFSNDLTVSGALGVEGTVEFKNGLTVDGGLYARTKKPTTVSDKDSEGSADGLSNVLIGHNDPGNAILEDFPKDLDKGGYPLVIKSLKTNDTVNNGAMVFGIGDIYALSGNTTNGWSTGTLCLNHRTRYKGDVQIGRNLNVGDNDLGGNVTIYSTDDSNGRLIVKGTTGSTSTTTGALVVTGGVGINKNLYVGDGANISSNSIDTVGLRVYGATGVTGFNGGIGLFVQGGTGGPNLKGGTGIIVRGGDERGTGMTGLGLDVQKGGAKINGGATINDGATINGAGFVGSGVVNDASSLKKGVLTITDSNDANHICLVGKDNGDPTKFVNCGFMRFSSGYLNTDICNIHGAIKCSHTNVVTGYDSKLIIQGGNDGANSGSSTMAKHKSFTLQIEPGNGDSFANIVVGKGKVEASEGFFQKSDETLKDFHNDLQVDFEKLSLIPKKYFTWKSDEEKHMEIGTSAQEVRKLYPELVSENENGILSVAYDKLSIIALKAIDVLNEKNKELEKRINKLESIILK